MIPDHPIPPNPEGTSSEDRELVQPEDHFDPDATKYPADEELSAHIAELNAQVIDIGKKLEKLEIQIDRLGRDEKVLASLHEERRLYAEDHHNKHFTEPILRMLIGIADRCRDTTRRLRAGAAPGAEGQRTLKAAVLRAVAEQRDADRIDVENLLAAFGVDAFEHRGRRFNASLQKCLKRVETDQPDLNHTIAERHRPGYRCGERVIRHEMVSVYFITKQQENDHVARN